MQLTSAFSRPQTVPAVPERVPKSHRWILEAGPELGAVRCGYAHALLQQGRFVEASTELQRVLEKGRHPDDADAAENLKFALGTGGSAGSTPP